MKPEDVARQVRKSTLGQKASQAHSAADRVYQKLTRPDRPLEPETHKQPWLAALLSFLIVGAGQLYNRQFIKALVLFVVFYVLGALLLIVYLLLAFWEAAQTVRGDLAYVVEFIWIGLWLFAVIDAFRIARLLKQGRLLVRYGFLKQSLYAAAGFIPFAGALTPAETCAPDEVNKKIGEVAVDLAKERAFKWAVIRLLRYSALIAGAILIILGLVLNLHLLLTLGSLCILGAILLFLI